MDFGPFGIWTVGKIGLWCLDFGRLERLDIVLWILEFGLLTRGLWTLDIGPALSLHVWSLDFGVLDFWTFGLLDLWTVVDIELSGSLDFGLWTVWNMDIREDWTLDFGLWTFRKDGHWTLYIRIWTTYSWTLDFGYWASLEFAPLEFGLWSLDLRTFGLLDSWTFGLLDFWTVGL